MNEKISILTWCCVALFIKNSCDIDCLVTVTIWWHFDFLKNLPLQIKEAQEKKLEMLKEQQELQTRLAVERKIFLRDRKKKFFGMIFVGALFIYWSFWESIFSSILVLSWWNWIFFKSNAERRKIERMIRRLEKQQRLSSDHISEEKISDQLSKLKEDLEYVRVRPVEDF